MDNNAIDENYKNVLWSKLQPKITNKFVLRKHKEQ